MTIFSCPPATVSVVLATHNGERFLGQQLASITCQTYPAAEIIVSDDASRDTTYAQLEGFARTSAIPVRLIRNDPGLGFGANFLAAASVATSELIAFCDQDDVWRADKLVRGVAALADPGVVLAVHSARLIDEAETPIGRWDQGIGGDRRRPPLDHDPWVVFAGFTMMFRATLLRALPMESRGSDFISGGPRLVHDRWVMYLANLLGAVAEIDADLVDYRQHGANLFGAGSTRMVARSAATVRADAARYVRAAIEQRALVDQIDPAVAAQFPLFDRAASAAYWDRAVAQQRARAAVYEAGSLATACARIVRNVTGGAYRNVHDARFRARALGRDILATFGR